MAALIVVLMLTGLFTIGADNGSCIDPNGRPCPAQTLLGDEGHGIDPFG